MELFQWVIGIPTFRRNIAHSKRPDRITHYPHGLDSFLQTQIVLQLVNKFPAFYGTRRFITAFTRARHLSLSWARSIQSTPYQPISLRSILILSSLLRQGLSCYVLLLGFLIRTLSTSLPFVPHAAPISFFLIDAASYAGRRSAQMRHCGNHKAPLLLIRKRVLGYLGKLKCWRGCVEAKVCR
jgi:hypothetical protein